MNVAGSRLHSMIPERAADVVGFVWAWERCGCCLGVACLVLGRSCYLLSTGCSRELLVITAGRSDRVAALRFHHTTLPQTLPTAQILCRRETQIRIPDQVQPIELTQPLHRDWPGREISCRESEPSLFVPADCQNEEAKASGNQGMAATKKIVKFLTKL